MLNAVFPPWCHQVFAYDCWGFLSYCCNVFTSQHKAARAECCCDSRLQVSAEHLKVPLTWNCVSSNISTDIHQSCVMIKVLNTLADMYSWYGGSRRVHYSLLIGWAVAVLPWNPLRVSLCLTSLSRWNVQPSSHLHRLQLYKKVSLHVSIHPFFNDRNRARATWQPSPWWFHLQTPLLVFESAVAVSLLAFLSVPLVGRVDLLLPTSAESFMSITLLEIYLVRCSVLTCCVKHQITVAGCLGGADTLDKNVDQELVDV